MTIPSVFNGNPAVDFPTVMLMHLDGARGILDYSKNRQTLTPTNASMGSTVTPNFGAQELTCPSNGYVSWPTKVVSADCTKPMTVEFWVNPGTSWGGTNVGDICAEISSITTPANGDWVFEWYGSASLNLGLYRWNGSGTNMYYARGLGPTTIASGSWHHIFAQVNSISSFTIGVDGVCYNGAAGGPAPGAPNGAFRYLGSQNAYDSAFSFTNYFQEFRITDGIARYPATGTYKVPVRQFG
jgi:hypothetical protein